MPIAIATLDWIVVAAYGLFVVVVGIVSKKKQEDAEDYLLGGGRLPWWAIGVSLIATSFSSLSLLGWTDKAYTSNFRWFQLQIGDLLAIGIVCVVFMPFFARSREATAYAFLEKRFGRASRMTASAIFHVVVLARAGLLLFATAAAGAELLGVSHQLGWVIVGVGVAAIAYSAVGGLGAVVWTDTVQLLLVVVGVGACFAIAVGILPGGLGDVTARVTESETPAFVDPSTDLGSFPTLLSSIFAYGVLALAVAGTNQQAVQRYLACRDLGSARRAAMLGWGIGAVVVLLTMGLGIAFAAVYDGRPQPADTPILATFMADHVPAGLVGVLIAAILAASMSSMDSAIHAMATATLIDFVEPLRSRPYPTDRARLRAARGLTIVYGVLAVAAAFYAAAQGRGLIDLLVSWLAYLSGPVLGLFLLGMRSRRVGERAALVGVGAGYAVAIWLNGAFGLQDPTPLASWEIHPLWTAPAAFLTTCAVAWVVPETTSSPDRS